MTKPIGNFIATSENHQGQVFEFKKTDMFIYTFIYMYDGKADIDRCIYMNLKFLFL